jgi:hypothetical protein
MPAPWLRLCCQFQTKSTAINYYTAFLSPLGQNPLGINAQSGFACGVLFHQFSNRDLAPCAILIRYRALLVFAAAAAQFHFANAPMPAEGRVEMMVIGWITLS